MASDAAPLSWSHYPSTPERALSFLVPHLAGWFQSTYGEPTRAQCLAWPVVSRGDSLLLCAPTGSGKTFAAFLPILGALENEPLAGVRCLYVAPLKALIRDAGKNLRRCLEGAACGRPSEAEKGAITIATRTGDTASGARSRLWETPPAILLTTPESLAVLLTHPRSAETFASLRWIVVDEVHALAASKRGADLALSLERLESLPERTGPLQRIGLSATCSPIETAARFLVGHDRPCNIAEVRQETPLDIRIEPLSADGGAAPGFMARIALRLRKELRKNRTTLVFTNIRSIAEQLTWTLKRRWPRLASKVAAHHSSMSAERRRDVESRLKEGELRVVVTSTSLELGIDIGSVDGVVFVHPPGGAARMLQRIGRSGHRPGQKRRGLFLTGGPSELLEAVVTAASGRERQLETLQVPDHPLDVLCQHLCGLAATAWRDPDETYALVCRAHSYRGLTRDDFDGCLRYLSGEDAGGESWLPPRLRWHEGRFAILNARTTLLLRRNLGTIVAETPRAVRLVVGEERAVEGPKTAVVGTLDDFYADSIQSGDRFLLGGRCFQFRKRDGGDLLVDESLAYPFVPHWSGGGVALARELARRLYLFRLQAAETLRSGPKALARLLECDYRLGRNAIDALAYFFDMQEAVSETPDARTLLVECLQAENETEYFFHTPLNRAGNDALARVAALRLLRQTGTTPGVVVADLGFMLRIERGETISPEEWRGLLDVRRFEEDLAEAIAESQSLRDRFARTAQIGFMVLRNPLGRKRKVGGHSWVQRRLFGRVQAADPGFPLLKQAQREMRAESCDAEAAGAYLAELPEMMIRLRRVDRVSPFAESWTQPAEITNEYADSNVPSGPVEGRLSRVPAQGGT